MNPIDGTPFADSIVGTNGDDRIEADTGNDTIWGEGGYDVIYADQGLDTIYGGEGDDYIDGDTILIADTGGRDTIYGGNGNDTLSGLGGSDLIYGGEGNDLLSASARSSSDGSLDSDFNTLFGGNGDDVADFRDGGRGTFDGGAGNDTIDLLWLSDGGVTVTTSGTSGAASVGGSTQFSFSNTENLVVRTYEYDDNITSSSGNDVISVGSGSNVVSAGGGDDQVFYETAEANTLDGGSGYDILTFSQSYLSAPVLIDLSDPTSFDDERGSVISGFEEYRAVGSYGDDWYILGNGDDSFECESGEDLIYGSGGDDEIFGRNDSDSLYGGLGADELRGNGQRDVLYGGGGRDRLGGGDNPDRLVGGARQDHLAGGEGADQFVFTAASAGSFDIVADFSSGADQLHVSNALISASLNEGDIAPRYLAYDNPSRDFGQFVLQDGGGAAPTLIWDPDGTGAQAGFTICVLGAGQTVTAGDIFIF